VLPFVITVVPWTKKPIVGQFPERLATVPFTSFSSLSSPSSSPSSSRSCDSRRAQLPFSDTVMLICAAAGTPLSVIDALTPAPENFSVTSPRRYTTRRLDGAVSSAASDRDGLDSSR